MSGEGVWVVFRDDVAENSILGVFADSGAAYGFLIEIEGRFPKDCLLVASFPVGWRFDHGSGGYENANRGPF